MALRFSTGLRNTLLGKTMVTNGKFTSDVTGWTDSNATSASDTGGQEGNCLHLTESGGGTGGYTYQSITVKSGRKYRIEFFFKNNTADNGQVEVGTAAGDATYYDSGAITDAAWTKYVGEFVAAGTTAVITLNVEGDGDEVFYDEVVLTPVSSIKDIFDGGSIVIRTGSQPTEPDDVASGTLLVTINSGGSGVTFDAASSGSISKAAAETWSGTCAATGTAGWFRLLAAGDLGTDNTNDERIDGAVATSGSQLNMSSTSFTLGATETISTFTLTLPMS